MTDIDTDRKRRPMRAREAERLLAAELLAELRDYHQRSTEWMARIAGGIVNDVLSVETATFGADGVIHRSWHVAAGIVEVRNLSTSAEVTVTSSGPSSTAPASGVGVSVVPAEDVQYVGLASHQMTLYGTEGERVCWQAYTRGVAS